jgi:hypothetical protein
MSDITTEASKFISDMLVELSKLSALQVLGGIVIGAAAVYLMNRSKESMLIALSAGLYAVPFLFL